MFLFLQWSLHPGRKVCYYQRRALVSPFFHLTIVVLSLFVKPLCLDIICCCCFFVVCAVMDSSAAIYGRPNYLVCFNSLVHGPHLWLIKCILIQFLCVIECPSPKTFFNCTTATKEELDLQCAQSCLNVESLDCVSHLFFNTRHVHRSTHELCLV